jgi:hypothetical protein
MSDEELTQEEEAEVIDLIKRFPCSLSLDFDGDKRLEKVSIVNKKTKIGLGIQWGNGRSSLLGAGKKLKLPPDAESISDFNWLMRWEPTMNTAGTFSVDVLGRPHLFPAPDALGDGLVIDGGDAAVILYLSKVGWRLLELGF